MKFSEMPQGAPEVETKNEAINLGIQEQSHFIDKEKIACKYFTCLNEGFEKAKKSSGHERFEKVNGFIARTEEEARVYLQRRMLDQANYQMEIRRRHDGKVTNMQILWKEKTGEIFQGYSMYYEALGRQKNGLRLLIGNRSGFGDEGTVYVKSDRHERDEINDLMAVDEFSEPFSGEYDRILWKEINKIEWNADEAETIGNSHVDCLITHGNNCRYPEIDEEKRWSVFNASHALQPEEWAKRIGHGSVVYNCNTRCSVFILVPQEEIFS